MRPTKKTMLPILVVLAGIFGATGLLQVRPSVATHATPRPLPLVRAIPVQKRCGTFALDYTERGTRKWHTWAP